MSALVDRAAQEELREWLQGLEVMLDDSQWNQLEDFLGLVEERKGKINLTSDSGPRLWLRHAADALAALPVLRRRLSGDPSILDLGAGAGFVGVTLKIAWPQAAVTLQESSYRKFRFLNEAAARMGIRGLRVLWKRAQARPARSAPDEVYDAVVARGLAPLELCLRLAAPLARASHGLVLIYRSQAQAEPRSALEKAVRAGAVSLEETIPYRLPREKNPRSIAVFGRTEALS